MEASLRRWRGKVALVTGASSGIGAAVATILSREGLKVMLAGRSERRLQRLAVRLGADDGRAAWIAADQTDSDAASRLLDRTIGTFGTIDVLVNNAGVSGGRGFIHATPAELQACLDLNVRSSALCMQEAVRAMHGKRDAAIINIGSLTGHRLVADRGDASVIYAASKHALRAMTEGLRIELAAAGSPIKVALISPGMVDTPWHAAHRSKEKETAYGFRPLGPRDVAAAVLYILSTPRHVQVCDILLRPIGQAF
jgi:NADP-dependent 3-hydroxy acid dehydrogenase YdfG